MTQSDDQVNLLDALVQASFATMAVLTRIGARNDLSLTQMRVLAILRDRRLRMSALAEYLGLDRSTISGLVDRGVARGLLERSPSDGDRRVVDVFLAAGGVALAARLTAEVEQEMQPILDVLDAEEQRSLASSLISATSELRKTVINATIGLQ